MNCVGCARRMWFYERVSRPQEYCRRCASVRGIERLCDVSFRLNMDARAEKLEAWWRWTVWLGHSLLWDSEPTLDMDGQRRLHMAVPPQELQ